MFIDNVQIIAAESLGVENRAEYYEESGVLRDMFQKPYDATFGVNRYGTTITSST